MSGLTTIDLLVVGAYFALIALVVARVARRKQTKEDYFLAGRNVGWVVIGASLFASNIGSEHLVGLAGSGAKDGVAMAHYELHAWCLLVLGWVLAPFYARTGVFTMPEFLERRYNATARWILSCTSLVAYVFTKVSVTVYAGGVVFETVLPELTIGGLSAFWTGAITTVLLTGAYTVSGGLRAVVYTDTIQAGVLILGSLCVTVIGLNELGGWGELRTQCGSDFFNMWKPLDDPDFPWAGMLFGAPIVGLWYWCTDQYIVQRTLAAANVTVARRGTIFGAYLKLTPVLIFIVPGMIAFALDKTGRIELGESDKAFPVMVQTLLPTGLRGLVVAGLLAALMSSLSSLFNSCSTLFTVDIYQKLRPDSSERTLVRVGRIVTAVIVALGILWIPVMQTVSGSLYVYLQSVQAYLAPPITAVFFLGVFSSRINAAGAVAGLVAGFVVGMAKLTVQILSGVEGVGQQLPRLLVAFGEINFLYFCILLFAFSCATVIVCSLCTPAPDAKRIGGLSFGTLSDDERAQNRRSWNAWDVIHTALILAAILSVYLYFTG
jgi:SSS family solute:Na+ symporter